MAKSGGGAVKSGQLNAEFGDASLVNEVMSTFDPMPTTIRSPNA